MATLYVKEYNQLASERVLVPQEPAVATQHVTIGASATNSAAFTATTRFVLLSTDAICSVAFGTNPTATASDLRLPADTMIVLGVPVGGNFEVSVITNT